MHGFGRQMPDYTDMLEKVQRNNNSQALQSKDESSGDHSHAKPCISKEMEKNSKNPKMISSRHQLRTTRAIELAADKKRMLSAWENSAVLT